MENKKNKKSNKSFMETITPHFNVNEAEKLGKLLEKEAGSGDDLFNHEIDFHVEINEEKEIVFNSDKYLLNPVQERHIICECVPSSVVSLVKTQKKIHVTDEEINDKNNDIKHNKLPHHVFILKGLDDGKAIINLRAGRRIVKTLYISVGSGQNRIDYQLKIGEAQNILFNTSICSLKPSQEKHLSIEMVPSNVVAFIKSDEIDKETKHRIFVIKGLSNGRARIDLKVGKKIIHTIYIFVGNGNANRDDNIVELNNVRIAFKHGNDERVIVNHMNLDIKRGEILGLVGESGSGKTTVGRAIIRVNKVSGGYITYNGHVISGKIPHNVDRALKTKMQMIFQDPSASLNDRANVDYIVSEGLRAFHLYKDEEDRLLKVENIMKEVGLRPEHLKRYPHEFSGGQRQRIGIARCMVMNPEFIVADEPISALDVSIRAQVLNLIKQFQIKNQMTVIFIAHDLSVVKYISDRIAVIYSGQLVEIADANRLFELPLHPYTKSLLSAIPIPDPRVERVKKVVVYNPRMHNYSEDDLPELYEVEPHHWVRCDLKEFQDYSKLVEDFKHAK